jgi:DNA helicase-2/ATP-dependent DNA helicase PcrA
MIPEMGIDELAAELLEHKVEFQTFFEQVYQLLENPDAGFIERIRFKASFEFLSKLNQYIIHLENNFFEAKEIRVAGIVVPFPFIEERFKAYHRIPLLKRMAEVSKDVMQHVRSHVARKITGAEKTKVWEALAHMLKGTQAFDLYRDFYTWMGKTDQFKMGQGGKLEYADVFPLIYCKIRLEGMRAYDQVKHLLVDEMQDYTAVQYSVISRLFSCKKTILGDVSQKVNPYSASSAEGIERVFPQGDVVKLFRSYRSTYEITVFAQRISSNPDIIPMERHGVEPAVNGFDDNAAEIASIRELITAFQSSGHRSLGIIGKTREQAAFLNKELKASHVHLLTADSTTFDDGIIITTAHLAKGLEFDEVIVPFVSARNYNTDVDRSMLYIACTRAMHRLTLTYTTEKTSFID